MDNHTVEMCMVVRRISISGLFWKKWTPCAPDQRRKGPSRLLTATSPKGVVSVPLAKLTYTSMIATYAAFKTTSFPGTPMHISTKQCKTTFRTHFKCMAEEEECAGARLACLQS